MCGRYALFTSPSEIAAYFGTLSGRPNISASWNMAPSEHAMVVRSAPKSRERQLDIMQWGFLSYWTKDPAQSRRPINARAETVATSSVFRYAFANHRALVPADIFYEWQQPDSASLSHKPAKQPYAIERRDGHLMALAGLWERAPGASGARPSFAIITGPAGADMVHIHERMPIVLERQDWNLWLGEKEGDAQSLLKPAEAGTLVAWPISSEVNSPKNNGPQLVEPAQLRRLPP